MLRWLKNEKLSVKNEVEKPFPIQELKNRYFLAFQNFLRTINQIILSFYDFMIIKYVFKMHNKRNF